MVTKLAFVAFFAATAAAAQPASQTPAQVAAEVSAKPEVTEKKICRRLPTTGTRLEKRACLTEKQWQELDSEMR